GLGITGLVQRVSNASVTSTLRQETTRYALASLTTRRLADVLPASVASLVSGESTAMVMNTIKLVAVSLVACGTVATGAVVWGRGQANQAVAGQAARQQDASASRETIEPQKSSVTELRVGPISENPRQIEDLELEEAILQKKINYYREEFVTGAEKLE